jgi:hypothetical protein
LRNIAKRFGTSPTALYRHKEHLPAHLVQAKEAAEVVSADSLLERLRSVNRETAEVLREAKRARKHELRLKALARAEKQIELEARLLGQLQDGVTVNLVASPEWAAIRSRLLEALAPFPAARQAIAAALAGGPQ